MTSGFTLMNSVTPVCSLRPNRNLSVQPKHTTRSHRFHHRKTNLPLIPDFCLLQLHSMILVLYQHHIRHAALLCDLRTNPFVSHVQKIPSCKLMSKGEREITSKINPSYRGRKREYSRGESSIIKDPRCLCSRGEMSHVFKRGKTCLVACFSSSSVVSFFCSDFLFPIFSQYPMQIQGEQDI